MAGVSDFLVEVSASLVGVFAGAFLALVLERRTREAHEARRLREQDETFGRARHAVLGSVVKNTAEATRIVKVLGAAPRGPLVDASLELSVWEATRDEFVRLSTQVDERVLVAQFFDGVERLRGYVEFHRGLATTVITASLDRDDAELRRLLDDADKRLKATADDVRFSGMMLVTDYGGPVHQRMLGIEGAEGREGAA